MTKVNDRKESIEWAKAILSDDNWCIVDTETTGLGKLSQIVQIGAIASNGEQWQSLVKPTIAIDEKATEIHGITYEHVKDASYFEQVFVDLWQFVKDRSLIFYNAEFDLKLFRQSLRARNIQIAFPTSDKRKCRIFTNGGSIHCAMKQYSRYAGEWSEQYGEYKYQPLPDSKHSALEDCYATLQVIKKMAETNYEEVAAQESNSTESSDEDEDNIPF
jgi:DNA polymerase III subunit epsilon